MKLTFDVHITHRSANDDGIYGGFVTLDKTVIFTTQVADPGGPSAKRDMEHEVAHAFAKHLIEKLG